MKKAERGNKSMKKKINYKHEPMDIKIVKDFLPSPEQLVAKEDN